MIWWVGASVGYNNIPNSLSSVGLVGHHSAIAITAPDIPPDFLTTVLSEKFKISAFRASQLSIITSVLAKQDCVALLPTGEGKSLCYQLPATLLPGLTIVISPLLSLMRDQVTKLKALRIAAAAATGQLSTRKTLQLINTIQQGHLKLLYVSPEKFGSRRWQKLLKTQNISLLVVDEAHCITQWGSTFRPTYTQIGTWLASWPTKPTIAAFTASATSTTVANIQTSLKLHQPQIFMAGIRKPHLRLILEPCSTPSEKSLALVAWLKQPQQLPAIIYCQTRRATTDLSSWLNQLSQAFPKWQLGTVVAYHAGMANSDRITIERDFLTNRIAVLVATTAFGMGVDKSNIRLVIHYQIPTIIENYYQEIGRAGRDRQSATAVLCYTQSELTKLKSPSAAVSYSQSRDNSNLHQLLTTHRCLNQQLESYFQTPAILAACQNCSRCTRYSPLSTADRIHYQKIATINQHLYPSLPLSLLSWLVIACPTTLTQLASLPGFGVGWQRLLNTSLPHSKLLAYSRQAPHNPTCSSLAAA